MYLLTEIGYDTSVETEESLIQIAQCHCEQYDDRTMYLPIDTLEKAVKYFEDFGFEVKNE